MSGAEKIMSCRLRITLTPGGIGITENKALIFTSVSSTPRAVNVIRTLCLTVTKLFPSASGIVLGLSTVSVIGPKICLYLSNILCESKLNFERLPESHSTGPTETVLAPILLLLLLLLSETVPVVNIMLEISMSGSGRLSIRCRPAKNPSSDVSSTTDWVMPEIKSIVEACHF